MNDNLNDKKALIAQNIVELRKYLGLTQSELAQKLNYSDKAVSKWERAESLPDVLVLSELTEMCGVTLDWLVTDHAGEKLKREDPNAKRNHIIIALLSVALAWLLATLAVVIIKFAAPSFGYGWIIFTGAAIVSEILLLIFNSIWGDTRWNYMIISALLWSGLAAFYFIFDFAPAIVFYVGIPGEIIILLWSMLSFNMKKHK